MKTIKSKGYTEKQAQWVSDGQRERRFHCTISGSIFVPHTEDAEADEAQAREIASNIILNEIKSMDASVDGLQEITRH